LNKRVQFIYKYLFLLVDHTNVDVSAKAASELLRAEDGRYLTRLIVPDTRKSYEAFFGFIVETLTMADTTDIFKSLEDCVKFKDRFLAISFEYAKDVVIKNDFIPKEQFEFLVHSLYAYNKLGKKEGVNKNNPKGLYLLTHLSRDFTEAGNKQAIRQGLYNGRPTFQVYAITDDLRKKELVDRQAVGLAISKGEEYQGIIYSNWKSKVSTLGILAHKPLQIIIHKILQSRGIEGLGIDTTVISDRDYNPDHSMRFTKKLLDSIDLTLFKKIIERNIGQVGSSLTVDQVLKNLQHMVLDYTLSKDKVVNIGTVEKPGKVRKHYQSPSSFFFIINYNKDLKNPSYTDEYIKKKMVKHSINDPEMVCFISLNEFIRLFKIDVNKKGKFFPKLDKNLSVKDIVDLIEDAKKKRWAFDELRIIYNAASDEYEKLKGKGVVGQYIGDLS